MQIFGLNAPFPFLKGHVRHVRPLWLLEEIDAPYDLRILDLEKGEDCTAEYLSINPFGKVPAIQDGELKLSESAAICTYIADKFGKLIPAAKTPERAKHDQWMYVAVTMIEPHTTRLLSADFFYKDDPEGPVLRELALENIRDSLKVLENHLSQNDYLLGNDFSTCDIMMTTCLRLASHTDLYSNYPKLEAYLARNTQRPAFLRATALQ